MQLLKLEKVHDGKYLKNYELTYLNKEGKEKKFEMVSRKEITSKEQLGARPSGVSIVAYQDDKIMLLKEFRMSINKSIYNLCAGMLEKGETLEQCIERELYEETGLKVKKILSILPPSFAAVGFSDTTTYFAFVETEIHDHDKTTLENVEWVADEDGEIRTVKVPVYKEEDSGFDMEGMTIQATTAEIGEEALLTVSAEAYSSVSQVIAVVVKEITETPDEEEDAETDTVMFTIGTREYTVNGKRQ